MKDLERKIVHVLDEMRADGNRAHHGVVSNAKNKLIELQKENADLRDSLERLRARIIDMNICKHN